MLRLSTPKRQDPTLPWGSDPSTAYTQKTELEPSPGKQAVLPWLRFNSASDLMMRLKSVFSLDSFGFPCLAAKIVSRQNKLQELCRTNIV